MTRQKMPWSRTERSGKPWLVIAVHRQLEKAVISMGLNPRGPGPGNQQNLSRILVDIRPRAKCILIPICIVDWAVALIQDWKPTARPLSRAGELGISFPTDLSDSYGHR